MTVSEAGSLSAFDPVLNAFRVLGQLYNLAVSQSEYCWSSHIITKPSLSIAVPSVVFAMFKTNAYSFLRYLER
jgi:hypothetical protein